MQVNNAAESREIAPTATLSSRRSITCVVAGIVFTVALFTFSPVIAASYHAHRERRQNDIERLWTMQVMDAIKPYFLSAYTEGTHLDRAVRWIQGTEYTVERYNHGLAHGLRQGALAKDIVRLILSMKKRGVCFHEEQADGLLSWVQAQMGANGADFIKKVEMAAAFQRTGRQREGSSAMDLQAYKKFELQDASNFRQAAQQLRLFANDAEIQLFEEAILWLNKGTLDEKSNPDLRYLRRVLHTAHTFDLRRMLSFDGARIQQDGLNQLFGSNTNLPIAGEYQHIVETLWERSRVYLEATGDRDLVTQRDLQDAFFLQTKNPASMVEAIHKQPQDLV